MPINADRCWSMPINANQFWSILMLLAPWTRLAPCSWLPGCFGPHSPGSLKPLMGSHWSRESWYTYAIYSHGQCCIKVVPDDYHIYFFGVKIKTVKLVWGWRFLAVRGGLNIFQIDFQTFILSAVACRQISCMTLRRLYMPAQFIQMMAFTQIMDIWTPGITVWDHLNFDTCLQ